MSTEEILPRDEHSRQTPRESQQATFHLKRYIEDNLWELNFDDGRSTAGGGREERRQ